MLIKFAVASNINFESKTVPVVVNSLIENGIDPDLIHVFSAGYTEYEYSRQELYHYHKLEHNSFEYSGLITIAERQLESEYWLLVHDTCKFGPNFKSLAYSIPESRPEKMALTTWPSMSIGAYRYDYLISEEVKTKLLAIKNTDYSRETLSYWKAWGSFNEDYILHLTPPAAHFYMPEISHSNCIEVVNGNENWYGTSVHRRVEYFRSLDLYKNKSNWERKRQEDYVLDI